jgi:hypothetical protein
MVIDAGIRGCWFDHPFIVNRFIVFAELELWRVRE